jgi:hypothetical protein
MISGAGAMDNVWLVILLIRANHNHPRDLTVKVNPEPNINYQNYNLVISVDIKKPLTFVRGLILLVTLN